MEGKKSRCPRRFSVLLLLPLLAASASSEPQHHHPASSFAKFYGPVVVGHDKEVRVGAAHLQHHLHHPQQNPHHEMSTVDYVAQPLYDYAYGVIDHKTGDSHGQKERRDGHKVQGEYHVAEPSGNIRTVRYWADETGFHATVHNSDPKAAAEALPPGPGRPSHTEEDDGSSEEYW
ncbi:hypothetical protein J437_LFUL002911 [Ladona fulva]|uniref:Uncharacterized protein n=1 Tax=Ladona fulva TaxID=123851 RepID=A0A8K0KQ98_LADFU|nr:hypothetical protein J437_LFUL002911 [Ladona fulva]